MIEKRAASLIEELLLKVNSLEGQLQEKVAAENLRSENDRRSGLSNVFGNGVNLSDFDGKDLETLEKFASTVGPNDFGKISDDGGLSALDSARDSFNNFLSRR